VHSLTVAFLPDAIKNIKVARLAIKNINRAIRKAALS
jgi:hypothetical protein